MTAQPPVAAAVIFACGRARKAALYMAKRPRMAETGSELSGKRSNAGVRSTLPPAYKTLEGPETAPQASC